MVNTCWWLISEDNNILKNCLIFVLNTLIAKNAAKCGRVDFCLCHVHLLCFFVFLIVTWIWLRLISWFNTPPIPDHKPFSSFRYHVLIAYTGTYRYVVRMRTIIDSPVKAHAFYHAWFLSRKIFLLIRCIVPVQDIKPVIFMTH